MIYPYYICAFNKNYKYFIIINMLRLNECLFTNS